MVTVINLLWILNLMHIKSSPLKTGYSVIVRYYMVSLEWEYWSCQNWCSCDFAFCLHVMLLRSSGYRRHWGNTRCSERQKGGRESGNREKKSFSYPVSSKSRTMVTPLIIILKKSEGSTRVSNNEKILWGCIYWVEYYTSNESRN